MQYLLIPLAALIVVHLIKYPIFVWQKRKFVGNGPWWSFMWLGNFPSVHSAVLASIIYLIYRSQGVSPLFGFSVVVYVINMYGFLEDKKRQVLYEKYFLASKNDSLVKMSTERILMDFSGHTFVDIIGGLIIGVSVAAILANLF